MFQFLNGSIKAIAEDEAFLERLEVSIPQWFN